MTDPPTQRGLTRYGEVYRRSLLEDVIPFWERYSIDPEGGYFTCLDRDGSVFDTDKFVWLQARAVYTFATLFDEVEPRPRWLELAQHGAAFLREHGRDLEGRWYFSLDRMGRPLVQPYNVFSDCFACMAFARLGKVTKDDSALEIARQTYDGILSRRQNPKLGFEKTFPGTRPLKSLSLPMILCNLSAELGSTLGSEQALGTLRECSDSIDAEFWDEETGALREHMTPGGGFSDSFQGRLVNPGHSLEALWFSIEAGERLGDSELTARAARRVLRVLELGWDREFGGIYYFRDALGHPPEQLEWDQKLWWVHLEGLMALAHAYRITGDSEVLEWFSRIHDYTFEHFPDPECGEWFGYLNRRGEVLLPLKGGKWKGFFHLPRAMMRLWRLCAPRAD